MDGPACFWGVEGREEVGDSHCTDIDCGDMSALERKIIIKCRGKREEILFNVEHVGPIQTKKRSPGLMK